MIKYKIEMHGTDHPLPEVRFASGRYALAAEFLLAEGRSFGPYIISALDDVCSGREVRKGFSGNVFSLDIAPDFTTITDDISERECHIPTKALKRIAGEYWRAYLASST